MFTKDMIDKLPKEIQDRIPREELESQLEILNEITPEYMKFREKVGKIAMAHNDNPFTVLLAFLETTIEAEKEHFEEAKKKHDQAVLAIVGALKIKPKEVLDLDPDKMTAEELKAILDLL